MLAIPGYVSFRDKTNEDLLTNYASDDPLIVFVRILYIFTMCFTYPISFFIARHICNELMYRFQFRKLPRVPGTPSGPPVQSVPLWRHLFMTFLLLGSTVAVTLYVSKLGLVMSLTGSVCAVCVAFVFPPICAISS